MTDFAMKKINIDSNARTEATLQADFNKAFPPYIIYLATVIILLSYSKDLVRVGLNYQWLLIRMGYLPFILVMWAYTKKKLQESYYEMPLWAAGIYITCFCTYFSLSTGGLKSDYIFGLLQLYFAIALMPITAITFYMTTCLSLTIYIGLNIYYLGIHNLPDRAISSTILPLIVFSIVVYIINSSIRKSKLNLQAELFLTIKQRDHVIHQQSKELAKIETKDAIGALAAQVAHDIRSPLAALNILTSQELSLPEHSRVLVRNVISRIRDITNDLIEKNIEIAKTEATDQGHSIQSLVAVISPLITEKRIQFRAASKVSIELELNASNYGLFVKINPTEFKRMLSNLINNSVEALTDHGKIIIKIAQLDTAVKLIISDNGKGIPTDIIPKLGVRGESYDKKSGSGLGLHHANQTMRNLNGSLELKSELGSGTDVILTFPKAPIPYWFLPKLEISSSSLVVILDDDASIHHLWKARFSSLGHNIEVAHFNSPVQFHEWRSNQYNNSTTVLYLFDLELYGHCQTGLKLIEQYGLQENSVLVTSHSEEMHIHRSCEKLGVRMIPKDLVVFVPIVVNDCAAPPLRRCF